jgi:phasin
MSETTASSASTKSKPKPVAIAAPAFEMPKFEMPKFEMPKFEVPPVFREFAEKGIAQAKENYEKCKSAAEQATDVLEDTYSTASNGYASYGLKVIETTRANSDAAFDLMSELMGAKSYAEVVELSSAFMRKQFEAMIAQAKELSEHAQKVATETVEPIKESINNSARLPEPSTSHRDILGAKPGQRCPGFRYGRKTSNGPLAKGQAAPGSARLDRAPRSRSRVQA